jgi:hypothetical protein
MAYFFLLPCSRSLFYSAVSWEGDFRNGNKYAELAYLKMISGNSGEQKRMASTVVSTAISLSSMVNYSSV